MLEANRKVQIPQTTININENNRTLLKIRENAWEYLKIYENAWTYSETYENTRFNLPTEPLV